MAASCAKATAGLPSNLASVALPSVNVSAGQTPDDHEPFPFMRLPTELRLHVYRMALTRAKPIYLHKQRPSPLDRTEPFTGPPLCVLSGGPREEMYDPDLGAYIAADAAVKPDDVNEEPLVPALLRANKQIYREAWTMLYSENEFVVSIDSAVYTLGTLHQRSRSRIKHIRLSIPSQHDILEGFADLVRLGLRYCWGLKTLTISLPQLGPQDRTSMGNGQYTNVYANAFHILRWLPKDCKTLIEGDVTPDVRKVIEENGRLAGELDEKAYAKRQHQMPDRQ